MKKGNKMVHSCEMMKCTEFVDGKCNYEEEYCLYNPPAQADILSFEVNRLQKELKETKEKNEALEKALKQKEEEVKKKILKNLFKPLTQEDIYEANQKLCDWRFSKEGIEYIKNYMANKKEG